MRDYEVVYIFKPDLPADDVTSRLERYHKLLTGDDGSEITAVEHWGKRQLAYPIQNELNGYYVVAQFRCDATRLPEYERLLKLEDDLLRYLVVLSEGELPTPPSARGDDASGAASGAPAGGDARGAGKAKAASDESDDDDDEAEADDDSPEPALEGAADEKGA